MVRLISNLGNAIEVMTETRRFADEPSSLFRRGNNPSNNDTISTASWDNMPGNLIQLRK